MGRWRPPRNPGSPYITPSGYRSLEAELESLWVRRRDVVRALSAAAAEGDRSENAEYIYRKKELAGIDRRVRYLQKRLPNLKVVRHSVAPTQVFFGARVTLALAAGDATICYRIVGEDEANPSAGDINIDSPLAKRLLKKSVGDAVAVEWDGATVEALVDAIEYDLEDAQ
ncbi:MAG: GreA/GreB family elongation factor [Pseudomonadota bacterium]